MWEDGGKGILAIDAFAKTVPHVKFFLGGAGVREKMKSFKLEAIQEAHSIGEVFSHKVRAGER